MVFGDTEAVMPVLAVHGRAIVAPLDTHDKLAHACTATIGREPPWHTRSGVLGVPTAVRCATFVCASELRYVKVIFSMFFLIHFSLQSSIQPSRDLKNDGVRSRTAYPKQSIRLPPPSGTQVTLHRVRQTSSRFGVADHTSEEAMRHTETSRSDQMCTST